MPKAHRYHERKRYRSMCGRKVRHKSIDSAAEHRQRLVEKDGGNGAVVYACRFCGGWHVGRRKGASDV